MMMLPSTDWIFLVAISILLRGSDRLEGTISCGLFLLYVSVGKVGDLRAVDLMSKGTFHGNSDSGWSGGESEAEFLLG